MTKAYWLSNIQRSYDFCRIYGVWLASVVTNLPILSRRIKRCKTITSTNVIDEEMITPNDVIHIIPAALELLHTLEAPERLIP